MGGLGNLARRRHRIRSPFRTSKIIPASAGEDLLSVLMLEDELANSPAKGNITPLRRRAELATIYPARSLPGKASDRGKGRKMDPASAVMRWYLQGKCDLEELILQLYFGHLSVSAVDSLVAQLWGKVAGAVLVSEMIPGLLERLDLWLERPLTKNSPSLFIQEIGTRPRRALGENPSRLAMVGGIDVKGYYTVLGLMAAPFEGESGEFWEKLINKLTRRGLGCPRLVIADPCNSMGAAVEKCWPNCRILPFQSEFEQELVRGISYPDRDAMEPLMIEFSNSANRTLARTKGKVILSRLTRTGYSALSGELEDKLHRHLGYFEIPPRLRLELRKAEKIRAALGQVRERARVIGPIFDDKILVWFAAAAFRRLCRSTLLAEPMVQVGRPQKIPAHARGSTQ